MNVEKTFTCCIFSKSRQGLASRWWEEEEDDLPASKCWEESLRDFLRGVASRRAAVVAGVEFTVVGVVVSTSIVVVRPNSSWFTERQGRLH